jgi:hypothetical protein
VNMDHNGASVGASMSARKSGVIRLPGAYP